MSISSIGDKQFVGGFSSLTAFPAIVFSPCIASKSDLICSGLSPFGFVFSPISDASHSSLAERDETPEKLPLKKTVIRESSDSLHIRCNCPK